LEEYKDHPTHRFEVTQTTSHTEFVSGVRDHSIGLVVVRDPGTLMDRPRYLVFMLLLGLHLVVPLIVIPIWAYHEKSWWLLSGIVVADFLAHHLSEVKGPYVGALLLAAFVPLWLSCGMHNYWTFTSLCALWGYGTFQICFSGRIDLASASLVRHPERFKKAVADKQIILMSRRRARGRVG
jgi:hypothetical protein